MVVRFYCFSLSTSIFTCSIILHSFGHTHNPIKLTDSMGKSMIHHLSRRIVLSYSIEIIEMINECSPPDPEKGSATGSYTLILLCDKESRISVTLNPGQRPETRKSNSTVTNYAILFSKSSKRLSHLLSYNSVHFSHFHRESIVHHLLSFVKLFLIGLDTGWKNGFNRT